MEPGLQSFNVTEACEKYMRDVLGRGRLLSETITASVNLAKGTIRVFPDPGFEQLTEEQFHYGGVWPEVEEPTTNPGIPKRVPDFAISVLASGVQAYLGIPKRLAVFEHALAAPNDPWLQHELSNVAIHRDGVYFPLEPLSSKEQVVHAIRRTSHSPGYVGILSGFPKSFPESTARFLLESGNFETLTSKLHAIVIGAFDGEGFIWWEAK